MTTSDPRETEHIECDCVPDLGPSHCHLCSERAGHPVPWSEAHPGSNSDLARIEAIFDATIAKLGGEDATEALLESEWENGIPTFLESLADSINEELRVDPIVVDNDRQSKFYEENPRYDAEPEESEYDDG